MINIFITDGTPFANCKDYEDDYFTPQQLEKKMIKSTIFVISLAILAVFSSNSVADMNEGMVAYYSFSGNANDSVGENHGRVYGAKLTSDKDGNPNSAYFFDGSGDKIVIPNSEDFNITEGVSLSFQMKREVNQGGSYYKGWLIRGSYVGFNVAVYDGDGLLRWSPDVMVAETPTDWSEYIFTVDNEGNGKLYKDRVLVRSGEQWFHVNGVMDMVIGQLTPTNAKGSYHGALDEIKIWNRELTEEEITAPVIAAPAFPDDKWAPAGSVHAHDNMIWAPNNKMVSVTLDGYVRDELSMARDEKGFGVSSAYLLIDGEEIVLLGDGINLLDVEGYFSLDIEVEATKGAEYLIDLYANDTNPEAGGGPNGGLVDSTYIRVPHDMSGGKSKK